MPNWCSNSLEITASRENLLSIKCLMEGKFPPLYLKAIKKSIKIFLMGCAGILKPTYKTEEKIFPPLTSHGTGKQTFSNIVFNLWRYLFDSNAFLDDETCRTILSSYSHVIAPVEVLPSAMSAEQREIVGTLMNRRSFDWFHRFPVWDKKLGADVLDSLWKELDEIPDALPFDMRLFLPTRLAVEINGFNGSHENDFQGIPSGYDFYRERYGCKWPDGKEFQFTEIREGEAIVDFETPWTPPGKEVFEAMSRKFPCEIRHLYAEEGNGFCGSGHYKDGKTLDESEDELEYEAVPGEEYKRVAGPAYILELCGGD